jgi:hypothetical protein
MGWAHRLPVVQSEATVLGNFEWTHSLLRSRTPAAERIRLEVPPASTLLTAGSVERLFYGNLRQV